MAEGVLSTPRLRVQERWLRLLRSDVCAFMLLVVVPIPVYALEIHHAFAGIRHGSDFLSFWRAGGRVLHLHSPYPEVASLPRVAQPLSFEPFVYPAPAALAMAPFALLPFAVAASLFLFSSWAAVFLALFLLDVRDWRCHAAAVASVPIVAGTALGAFSPWLLLGAAAAWRWRERPWVAGLVVAALVVAKLFLWPLWFWLVFTRRYTAALVALAAGVGATLAAWAAIGFVGLGDYLPLLGRLTHLVGVRSYSPFALLHAVGVSVGDAQRAVSMLGLALVAVCALRFRGREADRPAFVAALGIALVATPVLWPHYFALMFVPLAFVRTRFSWPWVVPLLLWFRGAGWSDGHVTLIVPALAIAATPFVLALRAERTA